MLLALPRLTAALAFCLALLPALALADPPARVGRLAYIENGVDFRVDRNNPGEAASINWPISSGAELESERRGRAEVWVGSSAFRLDGNSRVEFVTIDDRQIAVQLHAGRLAISILDRDQADDISVLTPDGPIRFTAPGRYRIDLQADHSELNVQAGQARVDDRGQRLLVAAGQTARLYAEAPVGLEFAADQDAFDRWVAERENATLASAARRYVSPQMTGYQDLDAHGDWRSTPEYGSVWYPRLVADDWAPYRFGRWAWVAPWGWTWIDQAAWGFAPFHYGRWVSIRDRWAWVPGRYEARPVYAPALVGWIGNAGWSLSFGFGAAPAVGWFPLAPREVYVPAYRYSPTYVRQLNITHVHDIKVIDRAVRAGPHESYAYRERPQAVTVVPTRLLREGRPIGRHEMRQPERRELERAPQIERAPAAEWLSPAPAAVRPRQEERRESPAGMPLRQERESAVQRERPREMRSMPEAQRQERPAPREMAPQIAPPPPERRREMRDEPRQPAAAIEQRERPREMRSMPEPQRQERPALREMAPQIAPPPPERRREKRDEPRPPAAPVEQRERPREMRSMPEAQRQERPAPREMAPQIAPPPLERRREMREEPRQPPAAIEQRERPREMRSMPEPQRQERPAPREMAPQIAPPPRPEQIDRPRGPERETPRQQERRDERDERGRGKRE